MRVCSSLLALTLAATAVLLAPAEQAVSVDVAGLVTSEEDDSLEALAAFARVYGYVRFFHPSDEAARIDWEKFAVDGARRVSGLHDLADLRGLLEELFLPVAPTLQFLEPAEEGAVDLMADSPGGRLEAVAWQHAGVGVSSAPFYQSLRLNRPDRHGGGGVPSRLMQQVAVSPYAGREFKLRFTFRTEFPGIGGGVVPYLEVEREGGPGGFLHFPLNRPLLSRDWQVHEVSGHLDGDAKALAVGLVTQGQGDAWFASPELLIRGDDHEWRPVSTFQAPWLEADETLHPAWSFQGVRHALHFEPGSGRDPTAVMQLEAQGADRLFEERPEVGDTLEREIANGLRVVVPLALPHHDAGRAERTAGSLREPCPAADGDPPESLEHAATRVGGVLIAWNILRHFYPYSDVVEIDWDGALLEALEMARAADSPLDYLRGLERMLWHLDDGHAHVAHPMLASARVPLPLRFAFAEGQVVVEAAADTTRFKPGDILVAIDGVPALEALQEEEKHRSGSPHFRKHRALTSLGAGVRGSTASVEIQRGSHQWTESIVRGRMAVPDASPFDRIAEVSPGIIYVDLMRSGADMILEHLPSLATAEGVILDVRGFPAAGTYFLFAHLTDEPLGWVPMCIQKTIRPEAPGSEGCLSAASGEDVRPRTPQLDEEVVILIDERAYSTPESYLKLVDHHRAATTVGRPTAGANGNYNWVHLPGEVQIFWTGMRVERLDGSQHHAIGVRPDIPVERTIEAFREGRDEDLETAVDLIQRRRGG